MVLYHELFRVIPRNPRYTSFLFCNSESVRACRVPRRACKAIDSEFYARLMTPIISLQVPHQNVEMVMRECAAFSQKSPASILPPFNASQHGVLHNSWGGGGMLGLTETACTVVINNCGGNASTLGGGGCFQRGRDAWPHRVSMEL